MDVVNIDITSTTSLAPYAKRVPASTTLGDFKRNIQLVVGIPAPHQRIQLRDEDGQLLGTLNGDAQTLHQLGIRSGMSLHIDDASGEVSQLLATQNGDATEKYEMADEAYDQREDSVRAWKRKLIAERGANPAAVDAGAEQDAAAIQSINVGMRCEVGGRRGEVAYAGETAFQKGLWVGVRLDEPLGKNDGSVQGQRYFSCAPQHGVFVHARDVRIGDYPPLPIDEDEI